MLLAASADADLANVCGNTALIRASCKGHAEMVRLLLEAGAGKDRQERRLGCTALIEASAKGHVDIARLLLEHGADPDMLDNYGQTAPRMPVARIG